MDAQDFTNLLNAIGNSRLVIRRAVHPQEVFEDVARHGRVAADRLDEILADDKSGEYVVDLLIEFGLFHLGDSSHQSKKF